MMGLTWKEQGEGQGTSHELSVLSTLTDTSELSQSLFISFSPSGYKNFLFTRKDEKYISCELMLTDVCM